MNSCVETVSPVENAATLGDTADFAEAPDIDEADMHEAWKSAEDLVSTEMQPGVSLAMNEPAAPEKRSRFFARWLGGGRTMRAANRPHVVHVRVNAFFASVEQALNPKLWGKAVLVGGGVVASASHEAEAQGVRAGTSLREALRICPDAMVVPGHYKKYADFAERVRRILEMFTPAVESSALDDFYLDFAGSGPLYPDFAAMLRRMQMELFTRTGLRVSIGAARTRVLASMASLASQPESLRGIRIVLAHQEEPFLASLAVGKLPSIGDVRAATMNDGGVSTVGQLRMVPKPVLKAAFGEASGEHIWQQARGRDGQAVSSPAAPKSIAREITMEGGTDVAEIVNGLLEYLSERIGNRLQESGEHADTMGVRIRYVDDFSAQQTVRLTRTTNDRRELLLATKELFASLFTRRVAVCDIAVNVTTMDASAASYTQSSPLRERADAKDNSFTLSTLCLSR